jgi:hypothetical protein
MMSDRKIPKFYLTLSLVGFTINLIWEINQMSYFSDKPGSTYLEGVFYCSLASIIDGLIIVLIYFFASKFFAVSNLGFYVLTAMLGGLTAIIFESFAFYLKLWSYKKSMPIVPFIDVGLLPFMQLILLVPLSIFLTNFINSER